MIDTWLWALPVLVLAAMAVTSARWGPFGILSAGVVTVSTIILVVGRSTLLPKVRLAIIATACSLIVLIFLGRSMGVISDHSPPNTKSNAAPSVTVPSKAVPNPDVLDRLRRGEGRGATLGPIVLDRQSLPDARLNGADAAGSSLIDTVLNGASLTGANLKDANLRNVHLKMANLRGANLAGADLRDGDLTDACLLGADLTGAILDGAVLTGAAVSGALTNGVALDRTVGWSTASPAGSASCLANP